MKKLVKPENINAEEEVEAYCEHVGKCKIFCNGNCRCKSKTWWADDDNEEILF